jgi:hypothetical protein
LGNWLGIGLEATELAAFELKNRLNVVELIEIGK